MALSFSFSVVKTHIALLVTFAIVGCAGGSVKCLERERFALLDFKKSFLSSHIDDGKLSSWKSEAGVNCCTWEGISCDSLTRHVVSLDLRSQGLSSTQLRPSLVKLRRLRVLRLSGNDFSMGIPEFIGSLSKLAFLDLSDGGFFGMIPPHIGNLSNIKTLDLSSNKLFSDNFQWLSRLSSLESLSLSSSNFGEAKDWVYTIWKFPSLSSFECSLCSLPPISSSIALEQVNSSTSLQTLDLSYNNLSSSTVSLLMKGADSLSKLRLSHVNLESSFPDLFHSMVSLEMLDLSGNHVEGGIFESIGNLCHLKELNASECSITQILTHTLEALSSCASSSLEILDLSQNNLTGTIPPMSNFPHLTTLDLSFNLLNNFSPPNNTLYFFPIPLRSLFLSSNSLNGVISDAYIANLAQLIYLDLSSNPNLTVSFYKPPFQLQLIELRSCKFRSNFPSWILTQKSFLVLDMSDSMIPGSIPTMFWKNIPSSLMYLNLSMNGLHDMVPNFPFRFSYSKLIIDLSSNAFYGPIPFSLFEANVLLLPKNSFSSFAPSPSPLLRFRVSIVDLSDNRISGPLPPWFELHKLRSAYMQSNQLSGEIPTPMGSPSCDLYLLSLCNNSFSGPLPLWLKSCTGLKIFDLSSNKLSGVVPSWIGEDLKSVVSITLQINHLKGPIPTSLCRLDSLQIMDLSHNELSGSIPSCVNKLTAMAHDVNSSLEITASLPLQKTFSYYAYISWKGLNQQFKKTLPMVKLIGLSNNNLNGEIPIGITSLVGLKSLDLSSNSLVGRIPEKIGQLASLELLNLSYNRLSGHIPFSLSDISSLGTFSLSHNNLSGRIPSSTQLQGFNSSSYEGNPDLCGLPLNKCPGDGDDSVLAPQSSPTDDDDEQFFYAGLGAGFAVGFLGILASLNFVRKWRHAFFGFASQFADWLALALALRVSRISGKLPPKKQIGTPFKEARSNSCQEHKLSDEY